MRPMINVVYKKGKVWFTGYLVGENWMYGIISKDTLSPLKEVTSIGQIEGIDAYWSLKRYIRDKRKYHVSYVDGKDGHDELTKEILEKFSCDDMYIRPVGALSNIGNTTICHNCMQTCKSNAVYACNRFTIKRVLVE